MASTLPTSNGLKPADILLVHTGASYGTLVLMALKLFQKDEVKFSHVLMAVDEETAIVAESRVRYRNIDKYLSKVKSYKIVRNKNLTYEQRKSIVERSKKLFNLRYGVSRIVLQFFDHILDTNFFTKWLKDKKIQICSTVPSWSYYVAAGIEFNGLPWQCVEPDDIDDFSEKRPDLWEVIAEK